MRTVQESESVVRESLPIQGHARLPAMTAPGTTTTTTHTKRTHAQRQRFDHFSSTARYAATRRSHSSGECRGSAARKARGAGGRNRNTAPTSHRSGHTKSLNHGRVSATMSARREETGEAR